MNGNNKEKPTNVDGRCRICPECGIVRVMIGRKCWHCGWQNKEFDESVCCKGCGRTSNKKFMPKGWEDARNGWGVCIECQK